MNRVVNVVRMQLTNKWTFLGIPAVILCGSFLLSLAIFAMIPNTVAFKFSGAGQAVIWYFLGLGIQALTLTFPFSQGLSISRRAFYLGSMLLFGTVALVMAVLYWLMGLLEDATGGWGMNGHMFHLAWVSDGAWYATVLFFFSTMFFLYLVGFWAATLYKRWQVNGMLVAGTALTLILVGLAALLTWQGWWPNLLGWFGEQSNLSIAGLLLALCVVLAAGSYVTLRKATP
ncbi:hypothetical protein FHU41_000988 [Psychromicrobium silvestre]|uniref:ABC-2 family transporter protein n=1 Tax=Psychromicrobium silvestre TaxID=1645614 RepID=A0A7Y9LSF9_9MICC|nr:hypothetical protein [Psychromicrobium silvestre]NYE94767.1 hypothetical protein [Psychromicrobium silvestre]